MKAWKKINSKIVYDSKYFKVRRDIVELPGKEKKEWTYWDSRDSAMVIGLTGKKELVMIKQYRYLVRDEVIEFPSGSLNKNENVKKAAKREFREETGYEIKSPLLKLGSFYETYGQLNRKIHLFFASNVVKSKQNFAADDDVNEETEVVLVNFNQAVKLAVENKIVAMGSALAILLLKEKFKNKF
ncbi:NUDIX hydrolase [Candidatus Falkowbacteria bacterium]|nr:NUDIX hydrolase [Candidatus Falkowbacteria bacterium]